MKKTWATTAALSWIEEILQERYGYKFSLRHQGSESVILSHGNGIKHISLSLSGELFLRTDSDLSCASWNADTEGWHGSVSRELPMPGVDKQHRTVIEQTSTGYHIYYDLLGFVYWMLSRQEEIGRKDLDAHGRFPAVSSHAYKHGYLNRPVVDEWLYILGQVIQRTWPSLQILQHHYSVKVSHDVDAPSPCAFKPWRTVVRIMAGHIIKRRNLKDFIITPYIKLSSSKSLQTCDPYNTFSWLMDQSELHNLQSAFYFICGRTDSSRDADYQPDHPAIRHLMREIHARGHEIGLHPSYATYLSPSAIKQEAECLKSICSAEGIHQHAWGGRMHYLRWRHPITLQAWQSAGMDYDTSLGYADHPGFRCGTCFEYPGFDPIAQQTLSLRIRPLIMMESSLIDAAYLGMGTGEEAKSAVDKLKGACKSVNGNFTLLWHNSYLLTEDLRTLFKYCIQ